MHELKFPSQLLLSSVYIITVLRGNWCKILWKLKFLDFLNLKTCAFIVTLCVIKNEWHCRKLVIAMATDGVWGQGDLFFTVYPFVLFAFRTIYLYSIIYPNI